MIGRAKVPAPIHRVEEMRTAKIAKSESPDVLSVAERKHTLRGRPPQLDEFERRRRLIDAAEHVFLQMGYGAASVDEIARRAGMSKKTIYRVFEAKQDLFAAVIDGRRDELAGIIEGEGSDDARPPEEVLGGFLRRIARFVLAPRQAALYRLVVAEAQRAPELAKAFCREGSTKACAPLMQWLSLQHERGRLRLPDPSSAAKMLFYMAIAELQMRQLTGERDALDDPAIDQRIDQAVRVFLDGVRVARADDAKASAGHSPALAAQASFDAS